MPGRKSRSLEDIKKHACKIFILLIALGQEGERRSGAFFDMPPSKLIPVYHQLQLEVSRNTTLGTSLVVQWLGISLPTQGMRVRSLT